MLFVLPRSARLQPKQNGEGRPGTCPTLIVVERWSWRNHLDEDPRHGPVEMAWQIFYENNVPELFLTGYALRLSWQGPVGDWGAAWPKLVKLLRR